LPTGLGEDWRRESTGDQAPGLQLRLEDPVRDFAAGRTVSGGVDAVIELDNQLD